ncbi:T9SS type A sorting domain-containing protein [Winogradskyella sp. 3972H.M.0a.05]|uniref:T9SS type A sorting domain-containing protein n=1 Tax=Winogradskyella sp. 3972H.M.0a.05 TaxID=2950277 RepID=UPI0033966DB9
MNKKYPLLVLLALLCIAVSSSQSVIVTVDRANIVGPTDTGNPPEISSTGLTRGSGVVLATNSQNFTSSQWDATSQAEAVTNNEYIEWNVSASAINSIEITEIDIRSRIKNGPANWQIFYSLDKFTTPGIAVTSIQSASTTATNFNFNGLSIVSGSGGTITFRLYAWGATTSNGWFRITRRNAWSDFGIDSPGLRLWGTVTTTAPNSIESNIVESTFDEPDNIDYTMYTSTSGLTDVNAIKIGEFVIQDGGDDLTDADALSTILTDIEFSITGSEYLAAIAIFDGSTNINEITSVSSSVSFNGLTGLSASDGSTKTFDVYATFNTAVEDNEQIQLTIDSATADVASGSSFAEFDAGGANTSIAGDDNRIEVTATELDFSVEPTDVNQFEAIKPSVKVIAVDLNGNVDLDFTGSIDITTTGTFDASATTSASASNGEATFNNLAFSVQDIGITLNADSTGLVTGTSTVFDVVGPLIVIAIQDFDGSTPEWTYTNDTPFFDNGWGTDGYYGIIDFASATPLDFGGFSGNILGENDLDDEGGGAPGWATITFDTVDISNYDDVVLSFDWDIQGYDRNADDAQYRLIYDGSNEPRVFLLDGNGPIEDDEGTISINIPNSVSTVALEIRVRNNGLTGYSGFDNFMLSTTFDGLIYKDAVWSPNEPDGSTGSDDALVINGTYSVNSDVIINDIFVVNSAGIDIEKATSLTVNGNLVATDESVVLNSDSDEYSSLIVDGNIVGDVIYNRHVNTNTGGNDLIAPPVSGESFTDFLANNSNIVSNDTDTQFLFGPFDKATDTYLLYSNTETATLNAGTGYRAASTDDLNFTFTGEANNGNVDVPIVTTGPTNPEWNLVGNPYPSYLSLSDFLATNSAQFEPAATGIYGYDGDASDGWTIWNLAYSDANPGAVVTPGQGFLVASVSGGGTVSFTPSMRAIGSSDDFIVGRQGIANNTSFVTLNLSSNMESYNTTIYLSDNASTGLDFGYDAATFGDIAPAFSIFSHLVDNNEGKDMAVQAIHNNDVNNNVVIPIGVNATQGQQLSISISQSTIPQGINVYLEDTVTNTFTLLNDGDYTLTPNTQLIGTGRFFLRFEAEALSVIDNEFTSLQVYSTANPKRVYIKGSLNDTATFTLYDIQGRQVMSTSLESNVTSQFVDVAHLTSGVYITTISSNNTVKTEKLILR